MLFLSPIYFGYDRFDCNCMLYKAMVMSASAVVQEVLFLSIIFFRFEAMFNEIGGFHTHISDKFAPCILPLYEIVIKSPLCLRPQLEDVMRMNIKSSNAS